MNYEQIKKFLIEKLEKDSKRMKVRYYGIYEKTNRLIGKNINELNDLPDIFKKAVDIQNYFFRVRGLPKVSQVKFEEGEVEDLLYLVVSEAVLVEKNKSEEKQKKIDSLQGDLTAKDNELTNQETKKKDLEQQINSLKEQFTSLNNEKKEIEQSKKDLTDKLNNSISQGDYDSIKEELEKEKNKDIERERERETTPGTLRASHQQRTMVTAMKQKNLSYLVRKPQPKRIKINLIT